MQDLIKLGRNILKPFSFTALKHSCDVLLKLSVYKIRKLSPVNIYTNIIVQRKRSMHNIEIIQRTRQPDSRGSPRPRGYVHQLVFFYCLWERSYNILVQLHPWSIHLASNLFAERHLQLEVAFV